jgi:CarboxypepD_reg-like domain
VSVKGKVIYKTDASPAAFVSVELANRKGFQTMTNFSGNFSMNVSAPKNNDTLVISAVGYQSIRMPLHVAANRTEFALTEVVKSMQNVTLTKTMELGSRSESVGYYRGWNDKHTGGEIGRIFQLPPKKKFKLDKVRFKSGNTCDTCLLRLHIRNVVDGLPADEILDDSISIFVGPLTLDTKVPEFDLSAYDFMLKQKEFYVGIEVLNCGNGKKGYCSFSFAGTEKGAYFFRKSANAEWVETGDFDDDYTIYLKLFLRY